MRVESELYNLIKAWGCRPEFQSIVIDIASHWKTPERWTDNLRQLIKNLPTYFR